ncbi:HNH endonuclease [Streptomyces fenghuangensis]
MDTPRAWLALSVGQNRQHGGNDGYDDAPSTHYSWDSTVPNHAALAAGDVIVLWDKRSLLGISVIEEIVKGHTSKTTYTCPRCDRATFKARVTKAPKYKCGHTDCEAEFDEPNPRVREVTTYRSRHDAGWVDMAGLLSGAQLRAMCHAPKSQLSLRPLRWERLEAALEYENSAAPLGVVNSARLRIAGGHSIATVRVRKGQASFRQGLLAAYGAVCAFTGPTPKPALEAAHLYSYAVLGEHRVGGGLLLRRDIHRLFDLGLIAVDPSRRTLHLSDELHDFPEYAKLHGSPVGVTLSSEQIGWLRDHWKMHRLSESADA